MKNKYTQKYKKWVPDLSFYFFYFFSSEMNSARRGTQFSGVGTQFTPPQCWEPVNPLKKGHFSKSHSTPVWVELPPRDKTTTITSVTTQSIHAQHTQSIHARHAQSMHARQAQTMHARHTQAIHSRHAQSMHSRHAQAMHVWHAQTMRPMRSQCSPRSMQSKLCVNQSKPCVN